MHEFLKTLKSDHDEVKKILNSLENTTSRALQSRTRLLEKLKELVIPHSRAEEQAMYDLMTEEDYELEVLGLEGYTEHDLVDTVLSDLEECDPTSAEWEAKFAVLKTLIEHHIKEEEGTTFKKLQKTFEDDQMDEMLDNFLSLKDDFMDDLPTQREVMDRGETSSQRHRPYSSYDERPRY